MARQFERFLDPLIVSRRRGIAGLDCSDVVPDSNDESQRHGLDRHRPPYDTAFDPGSLPRNLGGRRVCARAAVRDDSNWCRSRKIPLRAGIASSVTRNPVAA